MRSSLSFLAVCILIFADAASAGGSSSKKSDGKKSEKGGKDKGGKKGKDKGGKKGKDKGGKDGEKNGCPKGMNVCNDPHLQGLHGQQYAWTGIDGRWYALVKDEGAGLQVNVRPTAPMPADFPERQYITGVAVVSDGHSIVVEVKDPYTVETDGCPTGPMPCLAEGGLRVLVDGQEYERLQTPVRDELVADGIEVSSANLPLECREFGGTRAWEAMHENMHRDGRKVESSTFEDWFLTFGDVVAPEWCAKFVLERGLGDVRSTNAIFRISTPTIDVRFSAGVNHRAAGKTNRLGRRLPALDFWQTGVGVNGLRGGDEQLTGLLGDTAQLVFDEDGNAIMEGIEVLPAAVDDYLLYDATGTDFPRLHMGV